MPGSRRTTPTTAIPTQRPRPQNSDAEAATEKLNTREDEEPKRRQPAPQRALILAEGKRHVLPVTGAVVGRSRDCDVVLGDAQKSIADREGSDDMESRFSWRDRVAVDELPVP